MLNRTQHETHLRRLLAGIYNDRRVQNSLGFKGGTCLYMFYDLDRFSTDLDFNCITDKLDVDALNVLFSDYEIQDYHEKRNTWFWLLSYQKSLMKIKIEVSKRDYPDTYEVKELLGTNITVMTKDCMFAHKLCAITDRKKLQNRDLYDTYFMLKHDFPIREDIINQRTKMSLKAYLESLVVFVEQKVVSNRILDGLIEVLGESQKDFVKEKLKTNLLAELRIKIEGLG